MADISKRETEFLRHALGLNRNRVAYRNYYAANIDSPEDDVGLALTARGFARLWQASGSSYVFYGATDRGARAVLRRGERLDLEVDRELTRQAKQVGHG